MTRATELADALEGLAGDIALPAEAAALLRTQHAALVQAREALELGASFAEVAAVEYHTAMRGYRPERHAAIDRDVAQLQAALATLKELTS